MKSAGRLALDCRLPGGEPGADSPRLYRAGLVLPVAAPPIPDGGVLVAGGRIQALGPFEGLRDAGAEGCVELPGAVLMPGLVNAHCHLGLTYAQGLLPPSEDFVGWIRKLLPLRNAWLEQEHRLSLRAGLLETLRGGCTLLGEIVTETEVDSFALLAEEAPPLRVRAYREGLGWLPPHRDAALARLSSERAAPAFPEGWPGEILPGLSPHAPYSTHPELFAALLDLAARRGEPVCAHVAETADERRYMRENSGDMAALRARIGWDAEGPALWNGGRGFTDWLLRNGGDGPFMLVHGTWLDDDEIGALAARGGVTAAYCPGSVAWFHGGRDPHPVRRMLAAGLPVALGTDSLASSPTLNLPLTCTLARRAHPGLEPLALLDMVTRTGADALGFPAAGRLAVGGPADFVAFDLPGVGDAARLGAAEAVEGALLAGYRVPGLHVIGGAPHAFAALAPYPR